MQSKHTQSKEATFTAYQEEKGMEGEMDWVEGVGSQEEKGMEGEMDWVEGVGSLQVRQSNTVPSKFANARSYLVQRCSRYEGQQRMLMGWVMVVGSHTHTSRSLLFLEGPYKLSAIGLNDEASPGGQELLFHQRPRPDKPRAVPVRGVGAPYVHR
uniref:Uncharacterized protein n=1 Tax=Dunaliella tertiolecta TaxID=3047 RepID=A0A7S3VR93_DUNTE